MSEVICKFTDYAISGIGYFVDAIQKGLALRDVGGLTAGNITNVPVTEEHPLGQLVWNSISGQSTHAGIIPAIAVTEGDEDEDAKTIGDKLRYALVDATLIDELRSLSLQEREKKGLISDNQIAAIEEALMNTDKKYIAHIHEYYLRNVIYAGLWTHSTHEVDILGRMLRSIVYGLRFQLGKDGVTDISIRTSKGLTNMNFGKKLFGQETEVRFLNFFRNYTIYEYDVISDLKIEQDLQARGLLDE